MCLWQRLLAYSQYLFSSFAEWKNLWVGHMASQNKGHISQLPWPIDEAEWLGSGDFILSRSAMVKFKVRSLERVKCHSLPFPLASLFNPSKRVPPSLGTDAPPPVKRLCPSRACTLLWRTHSGYSGPQNSLCKWSQNLHRSLPQVCSLRVKFVICVHTLGPQEEPRDGCVWGVWTDFECTGWVYPSTSHCLLCVERRQGWGEKGGKL